MSNGDPQQLSRNGLVVGGVYLTFSGDYDHRFMFVKILSIDKESLSLKVYPNNFAHQPASFDPSSLDAPSCLSVSIEAFMGWGQPKFPVFVLSENVTAEEVKMMAEQ